MNRRVLACVVAFVFAISSVTSASAISQIFGFESGVNQYNFQGVMSEMSVQDPLMPANANWSASPIAITMWDQAGGFFEGGNQKLKNSSGNWTRRPYWSYSRNDGTGSYNNYPYVTLLPADYHRYEVRPTGITNVFDLWWCRGTNFGTCTRLVQNANMGRNTYKYAAAAGEGSCGAADGKTGCAIGYLSAYHNKYRRCCGDITWYSYCYDFFVNNVANVVGEDGWITACEGSPNYRWQMNYL